jgi:signal transduction histidine kinase
MNEPTMTAEICQVLLVDDDDDDYVVARDLLSEAEQLSFKLTWVDNYEEGLALINKNEHDVYLLDFRLGQNNGLELLKEAIKMECQKPIIVLTGVGDHDIDQAAMAAGASDYLVKGNTLTATLLERSILHAIERKRSELHRLELLAELASANQDLKDFAYIVSHDLKAPLRGIASLAEWFAQDYGTLLDDQGKMLLDLLGGRVRRMGELIDGVLEYSRVDRQKEEKRNINLHLLLTEMIDVLAIPAGINVFFDTELPIIHGEKTRIQQLFQNLIGNAIKYMGKSTGEIHIGYHPLQNKGEFYVSDDGVGIEEKYFEKIFQIFQTLVSPEQSESTGVGLAIVKKVVELYGGRIWLKSTLGQGSTFFFTLPLAETKIDGEAR